MRGDDVRDLHRDSVVCIAVVQLAEGGVFASIDGILVATLLILLNGFEADSDATLQTNTVQADFHEHGVEANRLGAVGVGTVALDWGPIITDLEESLDVFGAGFAEVQQRLDGLFGEVNDLPLCGRL